MIVREPGRDRWVVIDQAVVRNRNLSYRSRGVLAVLLSMPDNWSVTSEWLTAMGTEGRDAIRAALNELEDAGHMVRHKAQDAHGRWYTRWVVYESPVHQPVHHVVDNCLTEDGFPGVGKPGAIRNTYKETSTDLVTDMTTEAPPQLCTKCQGSGRTLGATAPHHPMPCPRCGGDGLHATEHS
jgi:hypothetical protein